MDKMSKSETEKQKTKKISGTQAHKSLLFNQTKKNCLSRLFFWLILFSIPTFDYYPPKMMMMMIIIIIMYLKNEKILFFSSFLSSMLCLTFGLVFLRSIFFYFISIDLNIVFFMFYPYECIICARYRVCVCVCVYKYTFCHHIWIDYH